MCGFGVLTPGMPSVERLHHEAQPQMHSFRIPDEKDFPRTLNLPITTASLDPLKLRMQKKEIYT